VNIRILHIQYASYLIFMKLPKLLYIYIIITGKSHYFCYLAPPRKHTHNSIVVVVVVAAVDQHITFDIDIDVLLVIVVTIVVMQTQSKSQNVQL